MTQITPLMFFMAHAPQEPPAWFKPTMPPQPPAAPTVAFIEDDRLRERRVLHEAVNEWNAEFRRQAYLQWPAAWAAEMVKQAANYSADGFWRGAEVAAQTTL
jgi:hypothetical protein